MWFLKIKMKFVFTRRKLFPRFLLPHNIKGKRNLWKESLFEDLPTNKNSINDMKNGVMHNNILTMSISGE